ncbi:hypothetical protein TCAL_14395 [Tigriopus californicus]|uniref:Uncharacterized protein n=1 Tax=Tigriopus californicus TaxID=6832 RepID=A0A553PLB0_TIGCA|nr:uncharacterized protein LOC131890843 isoform X2 [Tigriopus californicus]TRY78442.1 hypothetical protein TCAL_14395 [Tigriopus californicus]
MPRDRVKYFKRVILSLCLIGFVYVVYDQVRHFITGNTSTIVSFEKEDSVQFPVIVICPRVPFKPGLKYTPFVSPDEYNKSSNSVDLQIEGIVRFEYDQSIASPPPIVNYTYTLYNGLCKSYFIDQPVPLGSVLVTLVSSRSSVYFLNHPNELLYLVGIAWPYPVISFSLDQTMFHQLVMATYNNIRKDERPCDDKATMRTHSQCNWDQFQERTRLQRNISCIPTPFWALIEDVPEWKKKPCEDEMEARSMTPRLSGILHWVTSSPMICMKPCTRYELQTSPLPFNHALDSESEIRLAMSFLATDSLVTTEYKIYSFVSVLSAIGGTMSMFLGWSLYKSFDDIVNSFVGIFQSKNIIMVKS